MGRQLNARLYVSDEGGEDWQYFWAKEGDFDTHLLHDGDSFEIGNIRFQVLHTPGHTPEHVSFLVTDMGGGATEPMGIASGDFVFVGDLGRPDLLESAAGVAGAREPSARRLFASTRRFLTLDDHVQVWPGHGAGSACGKALGAVPQSTVGYERRFNAGLGFEDEAGFVGAILDGQPAPPLYFARMKDLNRRGIPPLPRVPAPNAMTADEISTKGAVDGAVVVDTRQNRSDFLSSHLERSIYAPLGINFAQVVGSYVTPEDDMYLVAEEDEVEQAVRILVRIGYDRIHGYITPSQLASYNGPKTRIESRHITDLPETVDSTRYAILDVRGSAEYAGAHVPGALHIPHTRLAARLDEVPADRPILTYCRSGNRASAAVSLLERSGREAIHVDGNFSEWAGLSAG